MRYEKTRQALVTITASALIAAGLVSFGPATTATPVGIPATVQSVQAATHEGHQRVSRSSTRVAPPQVKKNIVVKKKAVKPTKKVVKKKKSTRKSSATHTASGRKMTTSSAGNRALGKKMAAAKGWTGRQWYCLEDLWSHESQWSTTSGSTGRAYGIPQALPGTKMASAGSDWKSNPATQIKWGLGYISGRYGTPCGAWAHFESHRWY